MKVYVQSMWQLLLLAVAERRTVERWLKGQG